MLYEAYYPSELCDNHPVKIFYGFVPESYEKDYQLNLVVFYPKPTGTILFRLSAEMKAGLVNFLLQKHIYAVKASFIRVAFIAPKGNEKDFYAESWGINAFPNYVKEQRDQIPKKLLDRIFKNRNNDIGINSNQLTIELTDTITLIDKKNLDPVQTVYLLNRLKEVDYGDFNKIFGE